MEARHVYKKSACKGKTRFVNNLNCPKKTIMNTYRQLYHVARLTAQAEQSNPNEASKLVLFCKIALEELNSVSPHPDVDVKLVHKQHFKA